MISRRHFIHLLGIAAATATVPFASRAPRTCYFLGGRDTHSGLWDDSRNWLSGRVPSADDDVIIKGDVECRLSRYMKCRDILVIDGAVFHTNSQSFTCRNFTVANTAVADFGRSYICLGNGWAGVPPVAHVWF